MEQLLQIRATIYLKWITLNEQKINIKIYFLIVAKLFCLLGINNLLKNKDLVQRGYFHALQTTKEILTIEY